MNTVDVVAEAFDPAIEYARFSSQMGDAGAIVVFEGSVRGENGAVKSLYLEHYPGVTERSIEEIAERVRSHWPIDGCRIVHRVGLLEPGEPIVFTAVASRHRKAAFEAGAFLMDYLKTRAWFWKKESRVEGDAWIEPREDDYKDAARWRLIEE